MELLILLLTIAAVVAGRETLWDAKTWPTIKAEMKKALAMRSHIQRTGWCN